MRVAIPTFGADISPRFCFAREMLVVELDDDAEKQREPVSLGTAPCPERLAILAAEHVDVLLCGGFPRRYLPTVDGFGIQVIVGLGGTVEEILQAFRHGRVDDLVVASGHRPGCSRPGGRKRERRRLAGTETKERKHP